MFVRRVLPLCLALGASLVAAPQQPVFRTQVNLIDVDAVATDAAGRPVTDLRQDEFRVFEDGKPRSIVSFSLVSLPPMPVHAPDARDVASNAGAQDGRLLFLILDDVHTLRSRTNEVKAAARHLIERLGPRDQVAVLWMSLQKQGAREFSSNHAAVIQAIEDFAAISTRIGKSNPGETPLPTFADPDDKPWLTREGTEADIVRELSSKGLQGEFERARPLVMIREVCNYLAGIERRRKALVYVGQGPAGKLFRPNAASGIDIELDVIRAMTAARRANVAMYTIGAGGVVPSDSEGFPLAEDPPGIPDTLGALSRQTGGIASTGSEGVQAVDRVVADTGSYYLLGYYADPPQGGVKNVLTALAGNPWHGFRKIEVRSTRPGVTIRARRGYWAGDLGDKPPPERSATARDDVNGAVSGVLPKAGLALRAYAAPFRATSGNRHDVIVGVEVDLASVADRTGGSGFSDRAEFVILAVEPGEKVRLTERLTANMRLDAGKATAWTSGRYLVNARVSLPPGQYQVRVGARSDRAGRSGSVYADVTVPEFLKAPISLSGLVLDQRVAAAPMPVARARTIAGVVPFTPSLLRTFVPTDEVWAYLKAYRARGAGDGRVQMTMVIARAEDEAVVWSTAGSPPATFGPRHEVDYRVRLPLDRLVPGHFRLVVTAAEPGEPALARRALDFTVAAATTPATSADSHTVPAVAPGMDAAIESLLAKSGTYLVGYLATFSSVVAEESYEQTLRQPGTGRDYFRGRRLRSDFLFVQAPGVGGLTPFRDVFEVDGKKVRDRDDRLQKLFIDRPPGLADAVISVLDEGARYNIGSVRRNINQPMLALGFLQPGVREGFRFTRKSEEVIGGVRTERLDYTEAGRPTVIRQTGTGRDIPSSGSFWIEPVVGRVLKTVVTASDGTFSMESTVLFQMNDALGVPTPVEMREYYSTAGEKIFGKATYTNFRRFQVKTGTVIGVPRH